MNILRLLLPAICMFAAGCAQVPKSGDFEPRMGQPLQGQPVAGQAVAADVSMIGSAFPTSSRTPRGKPWRKMTNGDGFTGSMADACRALRLSKKECETYQSMHSGGKCTVMNVENGTVLDYLTYTVAGKHISQPDVLVSLENPPTRQATVCDLGGDVYAIRFHGCNNHAVVRSPKRPVARENLCTAEKYARINVWESSALNVPGVRETIAATRENFEHADRVSRENGNQILACEMRGGCKKTHTLQTVEALYIREEKTSGGRSKIVDSKPIGTLTVHNGDYRKLPLPELRANGRWNAVQFIYHDKRSLLESPLKAWTGKKEIRLYWWEYAKDPCKPGRVIHAIEKSGKTTRERIS